MFERNYFFFHHCLSFCRYVMFQKQYFELSEMGGAQTVVRGGTAPVAPRSNGIGGQARSQEFGKGNKSRSKTILIPNW